MGTIVDVLGAGGIIRPAEVVELAAEAGLDVAAAAVVLVKESSGGHNVWGRDRVETGGAYVKGGPVTRENYARYIELVRARRIGRQGVGPLQLTYGPLQDRADRAGGCWDWRTNVLVGFEHLSGLIEGYGERDGFRRYNGSGQMAEVYADDAMGKLETWRARLRGADAVTPAGGAFRIAEGDVGADVYRWATWLVRMFPAYARITLEAAPARQRFGPQTVAATAEFQHRTGVEGDGRNVGPKTLAAALALGFRP